MAFARFQAMPRCGSISHKLSWPLVELRCDRSEDARLARLPPPAPSL